MKCFGLFLLLFILSSCATVSPMRDAVKDAQNSVVEFEKKLPEQCKSSEINARLDAIKTKIDGIKVLCEAQVEVLQSEKTKWKTAFFALAAIVAAWVAKRLIK
jgi:hypothetical protein